MESRPPVEDWAIDFDHFDPQWTENPYLLWNDLRQRCPVATSQRFQDGAYFATRYDDVREIAYDAEHFSSRRVIVRERKLPLIFSPPITSDPPEHKPARKLLLPAFAPKEIAKLEDRARAICRSLLDAIGDSPTCDGAGDYARQIPVRVIAHMPRGIRGQRRPVPRLDLPHPERRREQPGSRDGRDAGTGRVLQGTGGIAPQATGR